jgi:hypothetical protein
MALFLASALVPLVAGGALLDYAAVPGGDITDARRRYLGIMVVEIGVGPWCSAAFSRSSRCWPGEETE